MKPFLTIILIFAASFGFAQRQNVYFLKNNGKYVDIKDSADYFRVVREPDSASTLYNVFEFYINGKKKSIGKSSTIDPPTYEEQYVTFYKNGARQTTAVYKKGLPVGDAYEFYPNGKPYIGKEYPDNDDRYNDINNNFLIMANYDSLGRAQVENGNGYFRGFDDKFKYINEEGRIKNGKRDSLWKGDFRDLNLTFTENYKDGELISGTAIYKDGKSETYTKTRGVPPQFKGGLDAFSQYLSSHIDYPTDARENNVQGRVILGFAVEKDGKLTNIAVSKSVSPSIDAEAVRVLRNSPRWLPGMQFGRPVRVKYSIPISFALTGN